MVSSLIYSYETNINRYSNIQLYYIVIGVVEMETKECNS